MANSSAAIASAYGTSKAPSFAPRPPRSGTSGAVPTRPMIKNGLGLGTRTAGESKAEPLRREELQVISGAPARPRRAVWSALLVVLILAVVAIGIPMVVNTQMAQRAYDIRDQKVVLAELDAQTSTLEAKLLEASSPQALDSKARELGLVPAAPAGTISLGASTVEGGAPAE